MSNQSFRGWRQTRKLIGDGLLPAIVVGTFVLSFSTTLATSQIERSQGVQTKILMDELLELAKTRPLTLQKIEKSIHVRFAEDTQNTNEYTRFYLATPKEARAGLDAVEVRFPTSAAATKQRMLVLLLHPGLGLTASDIRERLGQPDALRVGRPDDPEGSSHTYRMKAAELRFGILRGPEDRIRTIVIVWD